MAEAQPYWQQVLSGVLDIAGDYVRTGIRVSVKTNLGPELPIYSGSAADSGGSGGGRSSGGGLAGLLGLKAAVIVRDASGRTLATYGTPPPTDPVRAVVFAAVVVGIGWVFIRGLTR